MKFPIHRVDQQNALETVIFMVGRCVSTTPIETERTGEKRPLRKISRNVLCLILGFRVSTSAAQNAWHQLKGRKVTIMAEYIKREDAINLLWLFADESCASVVSDFEAVPSADVAEVRHGRWIELDECANEGVYCSVCHKKVYKIDYAWSNNPVKMKSPYCPNCGARMDKEPAHEQK